MNIISQGWDTSFSSYTSKRMKREKEQEQNLNPELSDIDRSGSGEPSMKRIFSYSRRRTGI